MSGSSVSVFCGNLDERVTERILYDIMIEAGPLAGVKIIKDKESKKSKGYGFAEYETEIGAQYAIKLFSGLVTLFGRTVRFALSDGGRTSAGSAEKEKALNGRDLDAPHDTSFGFPSMAPLPQSRSAPLLSSSAMPGYSPLLHSHLSSTSQGDPALLQQYFGYGSHYSAGIPFQQPLVFQHEMPHVSRMQVPWAPSLSYFPNHSSMPFNRQ